VHITKILLPLDGSESSRTTATYAADLAGKVNAEIVLLICYEPLPEVPQAWPYPHTAQDMATKSEEILDSCSGPVKESGVPYTQLVQEGRPARTIAEVAEEEGCDLIIMGSTGMGELEGLLLGSVTHKVLHLATCPVLVMPSQ
jgi:nucleotide-binding universal stress UspA family protein